MATEDFEHGDIDALIQRAAASLSIYGVEPDDVVESMVESGVDPGDAYLATRAAALMVQTREGLEGLPGDEDDYAANVRKKAWVETLLTKRDKIEKAIGMPLGKMLGCGHWGCVFESTPPWVVKLSIDPTEGPIWSKIAGLLRDEQWGLQGFTEIKSIHRITPDIVYGGRKKKVWAIVREGIEPVFTNSRAGLLFSPYSVKLLKLPENTSPHLRTLEPYGFAANDVGQMLDGLAKYRQKAAEWHDVGTPRGSRHGYGSQTRPTREAVAERIDQILGHYFHGPHAAPLGESLQMLSGYGIYLRDVHLLNIGWHVARDADDWDRIVIFDPGHTPTAGGKDIEQVLVENGREAL
jgi:hypothetical protein